MSAIFEAAFRVSREFIDGPNGYDNLYQDLARWADLNGEAEEAKLREVAQSLVAENAAMSRALVMIDRIGRKYERSYGPVEFDDIHQELALWVRQHAATVQSVSDEELSVALANHATTFARRERAALRHETDAYYYDPKVVREALHLMFRYGDWSTLTDDEPPYVPEDAGAEQQAYMIDVVIAFRALADRDRAALTFRYRTAMTWDETTDEYTVDWESIQEGLSAPTELAARKTVSRAFTRLLGRLNTAQLKRASAYEGPGARRVLSNAQAIDRTAHGSTRASSNEGMYR